VKELRKENQNMHLRAKHRAVELSTSSVADIAFLLLSFFLMTTVIANDQGLTLNLPEWRAERIDVPIHERNVFNIHINSNDQVMIESQLSDLNGLKTKIRDFVLNNARIPDSSQNPEKAVVSLKADRGTTHAMFIRALDEIQGAYYEIYAERAGVSVSAYRKLNPQVPGERAIIEKAKSGIPMNISLAEPSAVAE
jgi:biopolymer transport protein ExbD